MAFTRRSSVIHRLVPVLSAVAVCALVSTPVIGAPGGIPGPNPNSNGWHGQGHGVPGPVAGVGLPFLLVAGAIGAYRRLRRHRGLKQD